METQIIKRGHSRSIWLALFLLIGITAGAQYRPDVLGDGFEQRTIEMPDDYDGHVVCTLIRKPLRDSVRRAIFYVHGFNDYFFQSEMANRFYEAGFNFYAVDLRKYGRSILPHQRPFMVRQLNEYYADLDTCLSIMRSEGQTDITVIGHSTGGLITALYADARKESIPFERLVGNSPFYDFNESWFMEHIAIPVVAFIGRFFPSIMIPQTPSSAYEESLLKRHHGEWDYDTTWKFPQEAYPASWFTAIHGGHVQLQSGLKIPVPVLVLHSDKSVYGAVWTHQFQTGDAVLSVFDIARYTPGIAVSKPKEVVIPNGLHDLALSNRDSRERYYKAVLDFIGNK